MQFDLYFYALVIIIGLNIVSSIQLQNQRNLFHGHHHHHILPKFAIIFNEYLILYLNIACVVLTSWYPNILIWELMSQHVKPILTISSILVVTSWCNIIFSQTRRERVWNCIFICLYICICICVFVFLYLWVNIFTLYHLLPNKKRKGVGGWHPDKGSPTRTSHFVDTNT